jgi:hypothetical protein
MTLNKEDLMIGDWVMIKDYPMDFQPEKMTANHFVRSLCEFEAIPINKKFLLENGFTFFDKEPTGYEGFFELKTEHCFLLYSNKHNDIQIYKARIGGIDPESTNCIQINERYEINCGRFFIKYVHELQHILKLCKIDLELTCGK